MPKKTVSKNKKQPAKINKKSKFLLRHPLILPVLVFIILFAGGLIFLVSLGSSTQGPTDAHIVDIYADGAQKTVTTRAKTVGELLQKLDLSIKDEDITEPSREAIILEDNTQVNVYRARPVLIIDGNRSITLFTAQRAPRLVASDAGLSLLPEDKAEFTRAGDVLESGASEQLVITRSVEVQLNVYGAIKLFRTTAKTVNELLKEENISTLEGETVEPAGATPITSGMLISVNRPGVKTSVITEAIAHGSETRNDADVEAGKTKIGTEGVDGQRAVVYEIIEENGVEVSRKILQEVVLKELVTEIVLRGTKIVAPKFSSTLTVSGDKAALMEAAGISESDYGFVDYIITKESQWRPGAANSYSGAYGLCQALPASKMATAGADYLTNPITQLKWCSGYASRYGGWAGAYKAWLAQGWW